MTASARPRPRVSTASRSACPRPTSTPTSRPAPIVPDGSRRPTRATRLVRLDVTPVPDLADAITARRRAARPARAAPPADAARGAGASSAWCSWSSGCRRSLGDSIGMAMSDARRARVGRVEPRRRRRVPGRRARAPPRGRPDPAARHVHRRAGGAVGPRRRRRTPSPPTALRDARSPRWSGCCCSSRSTAPSGRCRPGRAAVRATPAVARRRGRHRPADRRMSRGCCALLAVLAGSRRPGWRWPDRRARTPPSSPRHRPTGRGCKTAPTTVTIAFDESVGLGSVGYLHVTDQPASASTPAPRSTRAATAPRSADRLKSGLGDGTYTASFRVISRRLAPGRRHDPLRRRQRRARARQRRRRRARARRASIGARRRALDLLRRLRPARRGLAAADRLARGTRRPAAPAAWCGRAGPAPWSARCSSCCCRARTAPAIGRAEARRRRR